MAKKTISPVLPVTLVDVSKELEKDLEDLTKFSNALHEDIVSSLVKDFYAKGGCGNCLGRGWVVTWDTMDYMDGSAAEYGVCPNPACSEETRKMTGLYPNRSKYDYNRGVGDVVANSDVYRCIVGPINTQISEVRSALYQIERDRKDFKKGDRVVVYRGRKIPIGTCGRIAWISANTGGILLKDEAVWQDRTADGVWVDPRNLEKIVVEE